MSEIDYPFLPEGREFKFVSADHPHMLKAKEAREILAGDPLFPVGAVLVRDGEVIAGSGNGFSRGKSTHICPRMVMECPSGVGYEFCDLHDPPGHAEPMLMKRAKEQGFQTEGADVYMYGHWWCCEPCWQSMIESGIKDVYLPQDAHILFSRDNVYAETLVPSVKTSFISGAMTNLEDGLEDMQSFYEAIGQACEEVGCSAHVPHLHSEPEISPDATHFEIYQNGSSLAAEKDITIAEVSHPSLGVGGELIHAKEAGKKIILLSKKGSNVSRFALGNPAVVYHLEYESPEEATRKLKIILRQL